MGIIREIIISAVVDGARASSTMPGEGWTIDGQHIRHRHGIPDSYGIIARVCLCVERDRVYSLYRFQARCLLLVGEHLRKVFVFLAESGYIGAFSKRVSRRGGLDADGITITRDCLEQENAHNRMDGTRKACRT